jgi:hypothetical protein
MFKWIKDKLNTRISNEMDECIHQNLKFAEYYRKNSLEPDLELDSLINDISQRTLKIKDMKKNNPVLKQEYIDFLLAHNKTCRKFWNQWFNKSDLDFDKNFHSKNS